MKHITVLDLAFTDFGRRHFDPNFGGTKLLTIDEQQFIKRIKFRLDKNTMCNVLDGYADFCKIIQTDNFAELPTGSLPITLENHQYLRSGYSARQEHELPILKRWFELPIEAPQAKVITTILYSKAQIEAEERSRGDKDFVFDSEWGIVSVMAQMTYGEEPMTPITMMRNALGKEEGGSGVPLNTRDYIKAAEYWNIHAIVK